MEAFPAAQSLQGSTLILLILPAVSIGNVGQLAADLVINTLKLPLRSNVESSFILPCIGGSAFDHTPGLSTAMAIYQQPGGSVAVAQQRAAAAPGTQDAFAEQLAAFVKQSGVKEVLVLGSIEASERRDAQLVGPQLRCWAPDTDATASADLLRRCQEAAPGGLPLLEQALLEEGRPAEQRLLPPWPLLRHLKQQGVPCAAILSFSSEGDNLEEAYEMAAAAAAAAGIEEDGGGLDAEGPSKQARQWLPPRSWQSLQGASAAVY